MNNGNTCYLDNERIAGSVETLQSIDNCLHQKNLQSIFMDIEQMLKEWNFEHGNYLDTYKESIGMISNELLKVEQDINNLSFALERTTQLLTSEEEKTVQDIQELSPFYERKIGENSILNTRITVIPTVKNASSDIAEVIASGIQEQKAPTHTEIDTIPIGIGIGVAGVVGAAGAVIYDSLKPKTDDFEYFTPNKNEKTQEVYQHTNEYETNVFEDPTPYYAVRNKEVIRKFYGEDQKNPSNEEKY